MTDKPEVFETAGATEVKELIDELRKSYIASVEVLPDGIYLHTLDFSNTDVTFSISNEKEMEENDR